VAGRERVDEEGNRITRWMIRFPSGDRYDGDPLGLGFGGGERICNPLRLGLWWSELVMEGRSLRC
jgi:hypothetical protein